MKMMSRVCTVLSALSLCLVLAGCSDNSVHYPGAPMTTPVGTINPVSVTYGTTTTTLAASIAFTGTAAPTGAVTITVNGSSTGVGTVTCAGTVSPLNCTAPFTVGTLAVGSYPIVASFAGDANYNPATASGTLTITQATPTITVAAASANYGASSVTLSATVAYTGAAAPSGALTFTVNGSSTGVGAVTCTSGASPHTCTVPFAPGTLAAGTYAIKATTAADTNYASASGTNTLTVSQPTATITVGSPIGTYGYTSSTLSVNLAYSGPAAPTGALTFTINNSASGVGAVTCVNGGSPLLCTATYTLGTLAPGTYPFKASLAADASYAATSATGTLTVYPGVVTVTDNSPTITYGGSTTLTLQESYSGPVAPTGAVTFTVNNSATGVGTVTCTGSSSPMVCTATYTGGALAVGNYSIKGAVAADSNYSTGSGSGTLTVNQATPTVTVSAVTVGFNTSSTTLSASVAYAGSAKPTGAVGFTVNGSATGVSSIACSGSSSPLSCTATYANASLAIGTYTISTTVAADTNYLAGSGTANYVVSLPSLTLTVTPQLELVGSSALSSVPLIVNIPWTGTKPNTNVSFTVNGSTTGVSNTNCSGSTSPLVCRATYNAPSTAVGTYPIVATIAADSNYAKSTGTANLVVEVQPGVSSGIIPVVGAHVHLLAAATTGYGAASTSVMTAAQTGQSDSAGPYVTADSSGMFTLPGGLSCTAGQKMYFYASGGTISGTANAAATFMAPIGVCSSGGTFPGLSQVINEVTTLAMAYGASGFATDPLHIADDEGVGSNTTASIAAVGMATAFATPFNLEAAGVALQTTPAGNGNVPQAGINTVANLLAACNESATGACSLLFANMLSGGGSGTAATDTATAAIYFAHNPYPGATQMTNLYGTNASGNPIYTTPYAPTLGGLPNDWGISIYYDTTSKNGNPYSQGVSGLAVDPSGNVWLAQENRITEVNRLGAEISPLNTGYTAGATLNSPFGVTADLAGNLWIANCFSGNVIEISSTGTVLSPTGGFLHGSVVPNSMHFDPAGKLWIFDLNNRLVQMDPSTGTQLQALTNLVSFVPSFTIDGAGNIWSPNSTDTSLIGFSNTGTVLSGNTGYTTGYDFRQTFGSANDASNNIWVSNYNGLLFKFTPAGVGTEYTAGGLSYGYAVVVDGANHVWVASRNGNLVEYDASGNALSPTTTAGNNGSVGGFQGMAGNIDSPGQIDVDQAGNMWVYSLNNGTVTEVVGAAAPSVAPLAAATKYNKIGQRP